MCELTRLIFKTIKDISLSLSLSLSFFPTLSLSLSLLLTLPPSPISPPSLTTRYTQQQYILEKAREKERNPHESTFTAANINTLFCNIEEILDVHRRLMKDLEESMATKGPIYETEVAACYLKHVRRLVGLRLVHSKIPALWLP